jgi:ParB-like chromosome segregation protein Spo0J
MSFKRILTVLVAVICSVLGPPGFARRVGPPVERRPKMAQERKAPAVPERATQAATRPVKVRLDQFVLVPERYCHRDKAELEDPARLRPLADSIAREGQQTPVEFYRDDKGRLVITKGHRRISALRLLAKDKRAGFAPDMEAEAIEVTGAAPADLVVRSVLDNVNRLSYTPVELVRAARTLRDIGTKEDRAAEALNVSPKTYARMLLIADSPWMFDLVNRNAVPISYAPTLLDVARKEKRLPELEHDLTEWVAAKEKDIKEKGKTKKLTAAQQLVKSYLTKPLLDHWVAQLRKKEKLDAAVPKPQVVSIDPDANKVSVNIDARMDKLPLTELARQVGEMKTATDVMLGYLKTRHAIEASRGPQDAAREAAQQPGGLDFLRSEGLGDLADEVELGLMEEAEYTEGLPEEGTEEATEGE